MDPSKTSKAPKAKAPKAKAPSKAKTSKAPKAKAPKAKAPSKAKAPKDSSTPLWSMTVAQLRAQARREKISLGGVTRKADIIKAIVLGQLPSVPVVSQVVTTSTRDYELRKMTVVQLRDLAKRSNVPLTGLRLKEDIVKALVVASLP